MQFKDDGTIRRDRLRNLQDGLFSSQDVATAGQMTTADGVKEVDLRKPHYPANTNQKPTIIMTESSNPSGRECKSCSMADRVLSSVETSPVKNRSPIHSTEKSLEDQLYVIRIGGRKEM